MSHLAFVAPVEPLDNRRCCLVVFDTLIAILLILAPPDGQTQGCGVAVGGNDVAGKAAGRMVAAGKAVAVRIVALEGSIAAVAALTAVVEDQLAVVVERTAVAGPTVVVPRIVVTAVARLTVVVVVAVARLTAAAALGDCLLGSMMVSEGDWTLVVWRDDLQIAQMAQRSSVGIGNSVLLPP